MLDFNKPLTAQSECGRLLLQNNPGPVTSNANKACLNSIQESRSIQQQAQARIEARSRWNSIDPNLKNCIDDALKLEGSSIDFKIKDGIIPSFENTVGYLNERKIKC